MPDDYKEDSLINGRYAIKCSFHGGGFSTVFEVEDRDAETGPTRRALKVIPCLITPEKVIPEAEILRELDHSHIVKVFDSFSLSCKFHIVMEYCNGHDLNGLIEKNRLDDKYFEETLIIKWLKQLLEATEHIHSRNIIHRDIKPMNIFIHDDDVKLGDFGVARMLTNPVEKAGTLAGTAAYMSPEVVESRGHDQKCDIWSIGCVVYELVSLQQAFQGDTVFHTFQKIVNLDIPAWPEKYSEKLHTLFLRMLLGDPIERPTVGELLVSRLFHHVNEDKFYTVKTVDLSTPSPPPTPPPSPQQQGQGDGGSRSTQRHDIPNLLKTKILDDLVTPKRYVTFIVKQKPEDMESVCIVCCKTTETTTYIEKLKDSGYTEGPIESRSFQLMNGSVIRLNTRGNIKLNVDGTGQDHFDMSFHGDTEYLLQEGWLTAVDREHDLPKKHRGFIVISVANETDSDFEVLCHLKVELADILEKEIHPETGYGPTFWNPLVPFQNALSGDDWVKLAKELQYKTNKIDRFNKEGRGMDAANLMLLDYFKRTQEDCTPDMMLRLLTATKTIGHSGVCKDLVERDHRTQEEVKFQRIAERLCDDVNLLREHEFFLRTLGLSDGDIVDIKWKKDVSLKEIIRQGILLWRSRHGSRANVAKIVSCLNETKHIRLAEIISAMFPVEVDAKKP